MTILYDHQAFTIQRYGGISRYFFHLINELHQSGKAVCRLSLLLSNNDYVGQLKETTAKSFFPGHDFKGKYQGIRTINNFYTKSKLKKATFDLLHPTYYDKYFLKSNRKPFVLTVYDLIHEKFAGAYPELHKEKDTLNNKKELLDKASRVIAISHSTKQDLIDVYQIDAGKIDVVHLASSFETTGNQHGSENYILFVGNRGLYKNFSFLLEVAAPLLKQFDIKLLCAGAGPFSTAEKKLTEHLGVQDKVAHQKIHSDEELVALYQKAMLFVFPSLYEGFGIPVLEALQTGCPTLVSNTSSFPEVGGNAVAYFDPTDRHSLYQALKELINNAALRNELAAKGLERSKQFSWAKCAAETLQTYRAAIG